MSLQKNVASQKIAFLMVDATDFATPETGLSPTAKYSKDGGGLSTCSNTVSEVTSGLYVLTLAQTETNADVVAYQMTDSSAADQWLIFYPENAYSANLSSILADTTSILVDTGTTLDDKVDSILADTKTLSNATYGLDALETLASDILSTLDDNVANGITSIIADISGVLSGLDSAVAGPIASILVDTNSTLDNKIDSILADTGTTLDDKIDSILADTKTLSNATYGLDALETLASDILSTLDDNVANGITSIIADISGVLSGLDSAVAGPISSILVDTNSTLDNKIDSILADTGTTLPASISDILSTIDGAGIKPVTAEPSAGAPSKTASTGVKIDHLYTILRNKIETTATTQKVYDDAGATVLYSCAVSDDATTFTKGKHA